MLYYAKPNPMLNIRSVRDRVYRGMCRKDPRIFEKMRHLYLSKMEDLKGVVNKYNSKISEKELTRVNDYLDDFFQILKSEELFKEKNFI